MELLIRYLQNAADIEHTKVSPITVCYTNVISLYNQHIYTATKSMPN